MSDDLIGFVLDATDASEASAIRRRLRLDPQLVRQVELTRKELAVLGRDDGGYEPPVGLAERTCQRIWSSRPQLWPNASGGASWTGAGGSWRMGDVATAVAVCLVAVILLFPAIANSRYHARRLYCQDQLRRLGEALVLYSQHHYDQFPFIPSGRLGVAGLYVPILMDEQLVNESRSFLCPADNRLDPDTFCPPSKEQLMFATAELWEEWRPKIGGSFGYVLGLQDGRRLLPIVNQGRARFAIMADAPHSGPNGIRLSSCHGGRGQNVLFEDGRVCFVVGNQVGSDLLFLNDLGQIAAGIHPEDSVIGQSSATPLADDQVQLLAIPE